MSDIPKAYIVNGDNAIVVRLKEDYTREWPTWYDSDNDARSPLEADLEDIHGEPMEQEL